jgi:hypothetical protein
MADLPGAGLRVLYAVESFPHLTQTYILTELETMRRFGVDLAVWSSKSPLVPYATDIPVYGGKLEDAIRAVRPHLVHTHWIHMVAQFRDTVALAGLPLTVRGHHPCDFRRDIAQSLQSDPVVQGIYIYERFASMLPRAFTKILSVDACFDPAQYFFESNKDRTLVLRVAPARTVKELDFFIRVAKRCPSHRFVLIAGTTSEQACPGQLEEINQRYGAPVELYIDASHAEISALMRKAGIYLYTVKPSEEYSMPISVSEAFGAGCYVVNRASEGAKSHMGGAGSFYENEDDAVRLIEETLQWTPEKWTAEEAKALAQAEALAGPHVLRPVLNHWLKLAAIQKVAPAPRSKHMASVVTGDEQKRLVLVLGMHRSGTSAVTRSLTTMGVSLGSDLIPAIADNNEKGFWEDAAVNALNDQMLTALGSSWDRLSPIDANDVQHLRRQGYFVAAKVLLQQKLENVPVFGLKDPRMAKLLPFWETVFDEIPISTHFILMIRHPLSVVSSLKKRDGMDARQAYLLWLTHIIASLSAVDTRPMLVVDYDRLMTAPDREVTRIAQYLDLELSVTEMKAYREDFLDEKLRHSVCDSEALLHDPCCPPLVREIYPLLLDIAAEKAHLSTGETKDALTRWLAEFEHLKVPSQFADALLDRCAAAHITTAIQEGQLAEQGAHVEKLEDEARQQSSHIQRLSRVIAGRDAAIEELAAKVAALYKSSSWKLTKPLRSFKAAVARIPKADPENTDCTFLPPLQSIREYPLHWESESHLKINDVNFILSIDSDELRNATSASDGFLLGKPRHMVESAARIAETRKVQKLFEMGILQGGSVVLYDQLYGPEKIVAIDHTPDRVEVLDRYIGNRHKNDIIKPYYGVNQANRSLMEKILSSEFPAMDIDIIVDDASHLYEETRDAFNISFPYLKNGGLYIIEDWAWAHWSGDYWQNNEQSFFTGKKALSNLLIELFMLAASRPDLVESISVDHNAIHVKKGAGQVHPQAFNIAEHYQLRGKEFAAWL